MIEHLRRLVYIMVIMTTMVDRMANIQLTLVLPLLIGILKMYFKK